MYVLCMYAYTYVLLHVRVLLHARMHICMSFCMYVCPFACMYVCPSAAGSSWVIGAVSGLSISLFALRVWHMTTTIYFSTLTCSEALNDFSAVVLTHINISMIKCLIKLVDSMVSWQRGEFLCFLFYFYFGSNSWTHMHDAHTHTYLVWGKHWQNLSKRKKGFLKIFINYYVSN